MAASKSRSKKPAAKKASTTRKSGAAPKKAAKARKPPAAGKKAAAARKSRPAAKKVQASPKTRPAAVAQQKAAPGTNTALPKGPTPDVSAAVADIDNRIAIVRSNLRELVQQAASYSGASDEERLSQRISEQEAKLEALRKQRRELAPEEE
jgi:hypothetical protein